MGSLTDKNIRRALIERYLDAETDVREEALLAEYFAGHQPDEDEASMARMLMAEHPEALLAAGERDFARAARRAPGRRPLLWSCAAAAAALALFLLLRPTAPPAPAFTPLEIAESLSTIADLGLGERKVDVRAPSVEEVLAELDSLTGLASVKDAVRKLVATARANKLREEKGVEGSVPKDSC